MNNFAKTINWFLITNKRAYIKSFSILAVTSFVLIAANTGLIDGYSEGVHRQNLGSLIGIIPTILFIASLVPAANICKDLKTKQQRTLYFMLPASNSNKFWARILIAVVSAFLLFPLAVLLADLVQVLVSLILCGDYIFATKELIMQFNNVNSQVLVSNLALDIIGVVTVIIWGFSSYVLGGFVFRKVPGVLTTVLWIIFWIVVAIMGASLFNYMKGHYNYIEINLLLDKELSKNLAIIAVSTIFTTLNLWLSYRIHKRMSIITNKWFNF